MSASNEITVQAVRLAMGMSQLRAEIASQNISSANTPGASATRLDFGRSQGLLERAAGANDGEASGLLGALLDADASASADRSSAMQGTAIQLDQEVADMSTATLKYQALTESLNRHFGLMRLAVTGRN